MKLFIYNYRTNSLSQMAALNYIHELMDMLARKGINTNNIEIVDGNTESEDVYILIDRITNYWNTTLPYLQLSCVEASLIFIEDYLRDHECIGCKYLWHDELLDDNVPLNNMEIVSLLNSKSASVDFKKAIIICKEKCALGKDRLGVATKGGDVCLIASNEKNYMWHEIAHLLGADDHYDDIPPDYPINNKCSYFDESGLNKCFMQRISTEGVLFCVKALTELKDYCNRTIRN